MQRKLKYFPIQLFAVIMGISGVTIAFAKAYHFLNASNTHQARILFDSLNETNEYRKEVEKQITSIAIENSNQEHFIVASGDFHEGVVGIVASRLVHHYKLPAIVFSDKGDILKGSGRSLGDVNIYELVSKCKNLLEGFGGHKLACGLSIKKENLDKFFTSFKAQSSIYEDIVNYF